MQRRQQARHEVAEHDLARMGAGVRVVRGQQRRALSEVDPDQQRGADAEQRERAQVDREERDGACPQGGSYAEAVHARLP